MAAYWAAIRAATAALHWGPQGETAAMAAPAEWAAPAAPAQATREAAARHHHLRHPPKARMAVRGAATMAASRQAWVSGRCRVGRHGHCC